MSRSSGAALSLSERCAPASPTGQIDADIRVVPAHPGVVLAAVVVGHLVEHFGVVGEGAEAVQKARRHPQLAPVLRRQLHRVVAAIGRRAGPNVDHHVEDRAAHRPHQLALGVRGSSGSAGRGPCRAPPTATGCPGRTRPRRRQPPRARRRGRSPRTGPARRRWASVQEAGPGKGRDVICIGLSGCIARDAQSGREASVQDTGHSCSCRAPRRACAAGRRR